MFRGEVPDDVAIQWNIANSNYGTNETFLILKLQRLHGEHFDAWNNAKAMSQIPTLLNFYKSFLLTVEIFVFCSSFIVPLISVLFFLSSSPISQTIHLEAEYYFKIFLSVQ